MHHSLGTQDFAEHQQIHQCLNQRANVKGWIDLQSPAQPKRLKANIAELFVFLKEKARDEKTAEHEEEIDATPSNSGPKF